MAEALSKAICRELAADAMDHCSDYVEHASGEGRRQCSTSHDALAALPHDSGINVSQLITLETYPDRECGSFTCASLRDVAAGIKLVRATKFGSRPSRRRM
jgi:hypothetical protein